MHPRHCSRHSAPVSTKNLAMMSREMKVLVPGHTASKQRGSHLNLSPPKFLTSFKDEGTAKLKFEKPRPKVVSKVLKKGGEDITTSVPQR